MGNDIKVKCTFSSLRFKNKPDSDGAKKVQFDLKPTNITIKDLSDALVHGASFRPGVLYGRSKNDWKEQYNVPIDVDINFDPYPILWTLENAPIPIRGHQTVPLLKQIPYCGHTPCPSG